MNINLTLLLQGIHFFIAYLIIRFLFVQPGMRELASDKVELQKLSEALGEKSRLLERKEAELLARKKLRQQEIMAQTPDVHLCKVTEEFPFLDSFAPPTSAVTDKVVYDMQARIVKRLSHVEL